MANSGAREQLEDLLEEEIDRSNFEELSNYVHASFKNVDVADSRRLVAPIELAKAFATPAQSSFA